MKLTSTIAVAFVLSLGSPAASGLILGQVDTFESVTTENWFAGGGPFGAVPPVPPIVLPDGGPEGPGDAFMQVTAIGGSGAGSRLVVMNGAQWAGDYLAAGIAAIQMDLRNFGTNDLSIRLLFEDPIAGPPLNMAISSVPVLLPAGGSWVRVSFPVSASALTPQIGDVDTVLANTTILRVFHANAVAFPGEPIVAQLGIDNIAAAAGVDEPASAWLVALALALALAAARPRRARLAG